MTFRGTKPSAQPRTLRTIAENKGTTPAGFDGGEAYDAQAGLPAGALTAGQRYEDPAAAAAQQGSAVRKTTAADPKPFK